MIELKIVAMDVTHAGSSEPVADGSTTDCPLPSSHNTGELFTHLEHIMGKGIKKCRQSVFYVVQVGQEVIKNGACHLCSYI